MALTDSLTTYQQRISSLGEIRKTRRKRQSLIAWSRFFSIVAIVAAVVYLPPYGWNVAIVTAIICAAIFLRLIVLSARNNDYISNLDYLLQINQQELQIAAGDYSRQFDGSAYLPPLHDYAHDLDIFGAGSMYQYVNRTHAEQGNAAMAAWLLHPADAGTIIERQQAVKELAGLYEWRQQLQAHGMAHTITRRTQGRIEQWLTEPLQFTAQSWKVARYIFPLLSAIALGLTFAGVIPTPIFFGIAFIFFIIAGSISRKVHPVYVYLDKIVREIDTLSKSIQWIEQQPFTTPLLRKLQQELTTGQCTASAEVRHLRQILDRLDLRLNPFVFIFLNTFLFWDLQQVLTLEKWKTSNAGRISRWFETLGTMEALSSLGALHFNHPTWTFPVLESAHGSFIATDLGHPLIPVSKRVTSSFNTIGIAKLALVTGSNMAGKSTFLRSIGVNIVLAMAGAPVCALRCTVSPMQVISSMRISDNLQENTSTFYAELKKLKYIIEAVNRHENVFLLLDEILRGTNSLDRQVGSKALIRQLIGQDAVGMLATHDLELADLQSTYPGNIYNYHFDVQVENEELYFDYKLKEGVCKSLNASILMKKIGIEMEGGAG